MGRHRLLSHLVLTLILVVTQSGHCSPTTHSVQNEHDFNYCSNYLGRNNSDSELEQCVCSADYPIVLDKRFCLPNRNYNQSCVLTEQCLRSGIPGIGCYRNGLNLLEEHNGVKQLVDTITIVRSVQAMNARCQCPPNHSYDNERRICLCKTNSTAKKCLIKSWHLITDQEFNSSGVHFAETIVFWIILMLILTLIFMVLTICRKCFCSHNSSVDYRTVCSTTTTTTLVDMTFINNTNDRINSIALIEDRPPTYEEAIRAHA